MTQFYKFKKQENAFKTHIYNKSKQKAFKVKKNFSIR